MSDSYRNHSDRSPWDGPTTWQDWRWLILCCGVAALSFVIYGDIDQTNPAYADWDFNVYMAMADAAPGILDDGEAPGPFAFRVFGPWLAGVLPGDTGTGFRVLTGCGLVVLCGLFHCFLRRRGLPAHLAALFAVMFTMNKDLFGFLAWDPYHVGDVFGAVQIVILFEAMISRRWLLFGAVLTVGAATREVVMLAIPTAAVLLLQRGDLRNQWWRLALASMPGVAVFVGLRVAIEAQGEYSLTAAFAQFFPDQITSRRVWLRLTVNAFAPLSLVPLVFVEDTWRWFRRHWFALVFLVLCALSKFFGSNIERLIQPAFIVFYWLVADLLVQDLGGRRHRIWLMVAIGLVGMLHPTVGVVRLPSMTTLWVVTTMTLTVITAYAFWWRIGRAKETNS